MRCTTRKQRNSWLRANGLTTKTPASIAATTAGARRASSLNMEIARAIRADTRRQIDIAASHGITQSMVSSIQRGKAWREGPANNSVFNMAV